MFLLLLACAGSKVDTSPVGSPLGDDTAEDSGGGACLEPLADILSPAEGAKLTIGEKVTLQGTYESTASTGIVETLWGVDGDVLGTGTDEVWIPDTAGGFTITFQVTDDCGEGQDQVLVTVS